MREVPRERYPKFASALFGACNVLWHLQSYKQAMGLYEVCGRGFSVPRSMGDCRQVQMGATDLEACLGRDEGLEALSQMRLCLREATTGLSNAPQGALGPANSVVILNVPGNSQTLGHQVACLVELAAQEIGFTQKSREPALELAEPKSLHVLHGLLKRCDHLMRVAVLQKGIAHETQGHTGVERVWGTREAVLARLKTRLPLASRCLDHPDGPRRVGLQPRVSQQLADGTGLRCRRQGLGKLAHEVVVEPHDPVRLA